MVNPLPAPEAQALLTHLDWVRRLARNLVADPHDAEDLVQETWLAATRQPPRPGPLRGWLARVVRNAAREQARRKSRRAGHEADASRSEALPSSADLVALASTQRHVVELVLALEEPYREVVLLRYFEGLSPSAIARRTRVPLATVKKRLSRALAALRARLDRASGGDGRSWLLALHPVAFPSHGLTAALGGALLVSTKTISIGIASVALLAAIAFFSRGAWRSNSAATSVASAVLPSDAIPEEDRVAQANVPAPEPEAEAGAARLTAPVPDGVQLTVIDATSGEPVPEAEVWYGDVDRRVWEDSETDRELVLRTGGTHLVCGARGEAILPVERGNVAMVARHGELFGEFAGWVDDPSEPIVIRLDLDRALTIQVVDDTGQPLADVAVGIRQAVHGFGFLLRSRTTAPDGLALLRHVDQRLPDLREASGRFVAAIDGVFAPAIEVALDPDRLPLEPMRLVLPATGRLVVLREDAAGNAGEDSWVHVQPLVRSEDRGRLEGGDRTALLSQEGRAVFERVELGLELLIRGQATEEDREVEISQQGPRSPGEEVVVRLRFTESYPVLIGRLLDEAGEPVSGMSLFGSVRVTGHESEPEQVDFSAGPDDEGSFRQTLRVETREPLSVEGTVRTGPVGNSTDVGVRVLFAEIHASGPFPDGEIDLDDLVLREPPVVLAGKVIGTGGEPIHWAVVNIARKRVYENPPGHSDWDWVAPLQAYTDTGGRFASVGLVDAGEYAYVAMANGHSQTDYIPFEPGTSGIEIVLGNDGVVEGSLLLPEGIPADRFSIELRRSEETDGRRSEGPREARALPGGRFLLAHVPGDRYDARVFLLGADEPLHTVSDVRVEHGETNRDARLQEVDLRDRLRVFELVLEGPDRTPVSAAEASFWQAGTTGVPARRVGCADGSLTLFSPWSTVDVEIRAPGYRTRSLESVSGGRSVVLEEGIPLVLELPPGMEPPEPPLELRLLLIPHTLHRRTFEESIATEDGSASLQWYGWLEAHAPTFGTSRRVEVRLPGAGEYVVEWEVARDTKDERYGPQRVGWSAEPVLLQVVEEDAGRLTVLGPDPEALRKAVAFWNTAR